MNEAKTALTICRTCRPEGSDATGIPAGAELGRRAALALKRAGAEQVELRVIACLSACRQSCAASVAAPGKFAYVVGGLSPEDAETLVTFAALHAEAPDGVPPWRARPEKVRKNTIARVPPPGHNLVEDIVEDEETAGS